MARCPGKNCKFTEGFSVPHSAECELAHAECQPDNSCGPNNVKVLNPNHEEIQGIGSAEYMKLLVLAMLMFDVEELVITPDFIEESATDNPVLCIANMEDGIHLKLVSPEEAQEIAEQEGGVNH